MGFLKENKGKDVIINIVILTGIVLTFITVFKDFGRSRIPEMGITNDSISTAWKDYKAHLDSLGKLEITSNDSVINFLLSENLNNKELLEQYREELQDTRNLLYQNPEAVLKFNSVISKIENLEGEVELNRKLYNEVESLRTSFYTTISMVLVLFTALLGYNFYQQMNRKKKKKNKKSH